MTSKEKSWHRKNQLGSRIEGWSGSRISVREKDKQAGNENHEFVICRTNQDESAADTRRAEREERPRHEKENQTDTTASGMGERDLDPSGNGKLQRAANKKPVAQPNDGC
jgi:hypothetical protein